MSRSTRLVAVTLCMGVTAAIADSPADVTRGKAIYARCGACHALTYNRTGPRHCGLFGRRAGSLPDFDYSEAMRQSRIVWSAATLSAFLENPMGAIPGTTMGYAGIDDPRERADLIAYLQSASTSRACRPS